MHREIAIARGFGIYGVGMIWVHFSKKYFFLHFGKDFNYNLDKIQVFTYQKFIRDFGKSFQFGIMEGGSFVVRCGVIHLI